MKIIKTISFLVLFMGLFFGCASKSAIVPESITGKNIYFYFSVSAPSDSGNFLDRNILYLFHDDGTYTAYEDGKLVDIGDYSYKPIRGTNSASLLQSYSYKGYIYLYEQQLDFDNPTSGTWFLTKTNDPAVHVKERGNFHFEE